MPEGDIFQTLSLSFVLGTLGLLLGRQLRIPSLLFYLIFGVLAGPTFLGIVNTHPMQGILAPFLEIAVAIIIFEAALALPVRSWKNAPIAIRKIITITLPITGIGAFGAAIFVADLPLQTALLFGSLIVVTGPTVIGPLLKNVSLTRKIDSVLRWESIWADCIGVLLSGMVLELILSPHEADWWVSVHFILRLLGGPLVGAVCGLLLGRLVLPWVSRLGDSTLPGIVALSGAVGTFFVSGKIIPQSGVMAAATAGLVLSRFPCDELQSIKHFKDQVTTLVVAFLFVFLSAQLDLASLDGSAGLMIGTAILVAFVIRPLATLIGLRGTSLGLREKIYIGLMGPRGIISAAVASYYVILLRGMDLNADKMHLLVFMTIFISGGAASLLGKPLARWLNVSPDDSLTGVIVVGIGPFSKSLAAQLLGRVKTIVVDSDPSKCRMAAEEGLPCRCGNAFSEELYEELMADGFRRILILTPNSSLNRLIAQRAKTHLGTRNVYFASAIRPEAPKGLHGSVERMLAFHAEGFDVKEANGILTTGKGSLRTESPAQKSEDTGGILPLVFLPPTQGVIFARPGRSSDSQAICLVSEKVKDGNGF